MKLRFALSAAATLPLVLGLAACGNDEPAATGYRPTVPVETSTAEPQKAAPVTHLNRVTFVPAMDAAIAKQKSWRITGKMTAGGSTILTMDGLQRATPVAMSLEMSGAAFEGKTAKVILIGTTAYVSLPGETPKGKFLKVRADVDDELAELIESGDPTRIYKSLAGAVRSVKFVGTEPVRRQQLDRYEVVVDTAKVFAAQGKKLPAGTPKSLTYSMWLDKSHLVRKLEFTLSGMTMELSMTDYNKPVDIKAPAAKDIVR
jgi:hypothetical protein